MATDVHQHIWPPEFIALLRSRTAPPRLDGWTLHLPGEPPYAVDPADHDIAARARLARADGLGPRPGLALQSARHRIPAARGGRPAAQPRSTTARWTCRPPSASGPRPASPPPSRTRRRCGASWCAAAWASNCPPPHSSTPPGWDRCAPLLDVAAEHDKPLFVHPGAAPPAEPDRARLVAGPGPVRSSSCTPPGSPSAPSAGRATRICGSASPPLAGLAPLHGERLVARGGGRDRGRVDYRAFYETSSYGTRAVDALVRAVGIDVVVSGSDRPYAAPVLPDLGADAAVHALRHANPARLLGPTKGARP